MTIVEADRKNSKTLSQAGQQGVTHHTHATRQYPTLGELS